MKEKKEKFNTWRWECIDAEVETNTCDKLVIYMSWPIPSKKNQKRAFRWIVLPSENYVHRHKLIVNKLKGIDYKLENVPLSISITSVVWDRVKSDWDNQISSVLDTLTDLWIIEDDNRFVVKEINLKNLGYIKNCWLHKIEIMPYRWLDYNLLDEHKGENLLNHKHYFNNLPY